MSRYLHTTGIADLLAARFSFLKRSRKGAPLAALFHHILCFFFDGTDLHLTRFERLRQDEGYAGAIETAPHRLVSSHAVKRFFAGISVMRVWLFRHVLRRMFGRRLRIESWK